MARKNRIDKTKCAYCMRKSGAHENCKQSFGNGINVMFKQFKELDHYQKTKITRCMKCKKDFKQQDKYIWLPQCSCMGKNLALSIG